MLTPVYGTCATCGHSLAPPAGHAGIYATARDNVGEHHLSCWSKPVFDERRAQDRIASLERRLSILSINHANLLARLREAGIEVSEIESDE
jgi:hypothetical protein